MLSCSHHLRYIYSWNLILCKNICITLMQSCSYHLLREREQSMQTFSRKPYSDASWKEKPHHSSGCFWTVDSKDEMYSRLLRSLKKGYGRDQKKEVILLAKLDRRVIYSPSTIHLCVDTMFLSYGDGIAATSYSSTDHSWWMCPWVFNFCSW